MVSNGKEIRYIVKDVRSVPFGGKALPFFITAEACKQAIMFHQSFQEYQPTPLVKLERLAEVLGVGSIYVKDESHRFGLNAFKVLGAAYAMGRYLCQQLGKQPEEITFDYLRSDEVKRQIGSVTFVTATDGNHGRAVAWAARQFGQKAVVYLPKGTACQRVEAIRETGSEAIVTDVNYDDAVRLSRQAAEENGWQVVQDTAWEGYTEIPTWIMQGYTTMVAEAIDQLRSEATDRPTHVLLQAGVGSMAGAVLGCLVDRYGSDCPRTVIVEPHAADCVYRSVAIGDGKPHAVEGDLHTIMAGLACGEPNPIGWEILRDYADAYVSCPDYVAANGMRILASPPGNDKRVVSGESGAVGIGLLAEIMQRGELQELKEQLQLGADSVVLCFSTEGDTDSAQYREIVWEGKHPAPARTGGEGK
ncbi:diaminopropionate ammonia-lyase [Brevibacillus sp. H7]|jgi:diaminopropionate ammonia-lyase|uniref:diaminopropionate ammonia-lyase n=1 Tax=Brevibacillus sp. H7 TaxID=3349138 RepID=UPI00381AAC3E